MPNWVHNELLYSVYPIDPVNPVNSIPQHVRYECSVRRRLGDRWSASGEREESPGTAGQGGG